MECPNCQNQVPDTANVCGHCGTRLRAAMPSPSAPQAPRVVPPIPAQSPANALAPQPTTPPPMQAAPHAAPMVTPTTATPRNRPRSRWALVGCLGAALAVVIAGIALVALVLAGGFGGRRLIPLPERAAVEPEATSPPPPLATAAESVPQAPEPTGPPEMISGTPEVIPTAQTGLGGPVASILPGAESIYFDDFDTLNPDLYAFDYSSAANGRATISPPAEDVASFTYLGPLHPNEAVVLVFRVETGTTFSLSWQRGVPRQPDRRRMGMRLSHDEPVVEYFQFDPLISEFTMAGSDSLQPGGWYYAVLYLDESSGFQAAYWPQERPDQRVEHYNAFGDPAAWNYPEWEFGIAVDGSGTMIIDEFMVVRAGTG